MLNVNTAVARLETHRHRRERHCPNVLALFQLTKESWPDWKTDDRLHVVEHQLERKRERKKERTSWNVYWVYMTMCGYAYIVLSGCLRSNRFIVLILLKFEFFIQSAAITNTRVTLRPTVGQLDFFMLISQKIRLKSTDSSSYNENKPRWLILSITKFFKLANHYLIIRRSPADRMIKLYDFGFSINGRFAYSSEIDSLYLVVFRLKKKKIKRKQRVKNKLYMNALKNMGRGL